MKRGCQIVIEQPLSSVSWLGAYGGSQWINALYRVWKTLQLRFQKCQGHVALETSAKILAMVKIKANILIYNSHAMFFHIFDIPHFDWIGVSPSPWGAMVPEA